MEGEQKKEKKNSRYKACFLFSLLSVIADRRDVGWDPGAVTWITSVRRGGFAASKVLSWLSVPLLLLSLALFLFSAVGQPLCSFPSTMASDIRGQTEDGSVQGCGLRE